MSIHKDVIIVGGGVIGCSIAYHLGKRGIKSTIIERESIGARASGKAWAVISYPGALRLFEREPAEHSLFSTVGAESFTNWMDLFANTYHRLEDIAADLKSLGGIDIELGNNPIDFLAFDEKAHSLLQTELNVLQEEGFREMFWLDPEVVKAQYPNINPSLAGGIRISVYQVEPYKYTLGYAQAAEKMGAQVKQGNVVGFGTKSGRITSVKLESGKEITADTVVIAMGPWSCEGTRWLGKELPVQLVLESCLRMQTTRPLPLQGFGNGIVVVLPRVVKGEFIVGSPGIPHLKQDHWGTALSEDHKMELLEGALEMNPDLEDAKIVEYRGDLQGWAPTHPHMKPVMGRIPEWENGYTAFRFGTLGMCQSAGVGRIMAQMIDTGKRPVNHVKMLESLDPVHG